MVFLKFDWKGEKMNRNKFLTKALTSGLCASMIVGNITPVLAVTTNTQEVEETEVETGTTRDAEVLYEQSATYFVTIPKTIVLDGISKDSAYSVKVAGDIPSDKQVYVSPIDGIADKDGFNFYMHDQNTKNPKSDVVADVTQNKFYWNFEDVASAYEATDNSVAASDLSSGTWKGTFDFEINMHKIENADTGITLSTDGDVTMGLDDTVQVDAYVNGEKATESVTWTSNNSSINVDKGLIKTSASAAVGDTATITVIANNTTELAAVDKALSSLGVMTVKATDELSASFKVTIVDIELSAYDLYINPGESATLSATILPLGTEGTVNWTRTAVSGLNLVKNGNSVDISVASDMEIGKTYSVVASLDDFSKVCTIHIGEKTEEHTHSYTENVTKKPTCTETGEKTYICDCGDTYTEEIPATSHNYVDGTCTECGEKDPDYSQNIELSAGLYDSNDTMLASWDELINNYGLDIQSDYTSSTYNTNESSLYCILHNNDEFSTASKLIIGDGVVQIGDYALFGCSCLTDVSIPEGVVIIGAHSFESCKLTSIEIPASVDTIEYSAFAYSSNITSAIIGARVIEDNAFYNNSKLTNLELKDGVQKIGAYAFANNTSLTGSLELPSTITTIGNLAFKSCSKLTTAYLPSSITSLYFSNKSYGPFYSCLSSLKLYCEHESAPSGWYGWNYRTSSSQITTKWGVSRAVYEAVYK